MPETFSTQLTGLARYADRNASLAPAAALRGRATRRTRRRRGGAAALLGGGALAVAISLGVTNAGVSPAHTVVMPARSAASSSPESMSPGSVQLTAYQTTVLANAHVTKANLAVLKKLHLTPLQIKALAVAYRTAQQIAGPKGSDRQLTVAEIASVVKVKATVAQIAALGFANMTVAQIEAIAKADLTAAQLAALGG